MEIALTDGQKEALAAVQQAFEVNLSPEEEKAVVLALIQRHELQELRAAQQANRAMFAADGQRGG